ncbi:MAG: urea ABC transporter ATP-binding subunit UrtE [Oscillospiraceae bacterium]|nr:urea ABC transporter ATP-binding subunit UrtE [Oscillospiraceae bacterium]
MLELHDLTATYGEGLVLHGVNLTARAERVTCLIGRNGVGKTTTLRAVMGLMKTPNGSVTFSGEDITKQPTNVRVRKGIGYVPQGREIFPQISVRENLLLGLEANPQIKEIDPFVFELFPILKEFLARKGGDLSGGQQQQLAIARALVSKPKLLILDEPTEGIQPSVIQQIGDVIRKLIQRGGLTIFIVEQYVEFVMGIADDFYVMDKGSIVMQGETENADMKAIQQKVSI